MEEKTRLEDVESKLFTMCESQVNPDLNKLFKNCMTVMKQLEI